MASRLQTTLAGFLAPSEAIDRFSPEIGQKRGRLSPSPVPESPKKQKLSLRIDIPAPTVAGINDGNLIIGAECHNASAQDTWSSLFTPVDGSSSDSDSLFDEILSVTTGTQPSSIDTAVDISTHASQLAASRSAPPIPGLFFNPSLLLPEDLALRVHTTCMETYFREPHVNQVMLFNRAPEGLDLPSTTSPSSSSSSFQPVLHELLSCISSSLLPYIPKETHQLLFPTRPTLARQAILNLYAPGEGITPHVDLLRRFDDGIIGVSFGSACTMRFDRVRESTDVDGTEAQRITLTSSDAHPSQDRYDLYLPERSVLVLSEDARYKWTHGIDRRLEDSVEEEAGDGRSSSIKRGTRMSITFRWLLPGAEIVGRYGSESPAV